MNPQPPSTSDAAAGLGIEDLRSLVDTSRTLGREIHLPRLLNRILQEATRLTDSRDASVLLLDERRSCLYFADALGDAAPMLLATWGRDGARGVPLIGSKAGQVFTGLKSIVVDAVPQDPLHFKGVDRATRHRTESMVCVPLVSAGREDGRPRALGVVQLLNKRTGNFSERDRVLLEHFAEQAAIAIDNARLVSELFANKGLYSADGTDPLELLARPAWHETLSVLLADMRGFTQLCHLVVRPERTQAMLNEFLGLLADQVIAHHGVVNKFLGDGLMALFRGPSHAAAAVDCALAMLTQFDDLKANWNRDSNVSLDFVDLGIGISTEDVILGTVGSERMWDFTAIGTGVNLAAALMEQARGGRRLMVDRVTHRAVADRGLPFEGPEVFELRKPDQTVAHPYERHWLRPDPLRVAKPTGGPAPSGATPARTCRLFISYSHLDDGWRRMLRTHLEPYVVAGTIEVWDDTAIEAGKTWKSAIDDALQRATVVLFLVTPHLLASPFVREEELAPALRRAQMRDVRILWLPVVSSSYEETAFQPLQAAMPPDVPLDAMAEAQRHRVMVALCRMIKATTQA